MIRLQTGPDRAAHAVIWGCARLRSAAAPFAVGACIAGAYRFTASASFANPAVTLARSASDSFAGIRPADAPGFIAAQLAGAAAATLLFRWLAPSLRKDAASVVVAHSFSVNPEIPPAVKWRKGCCATMPGNELGINISGHRSKPVAEFDGQQFDYVITVCDSARESCPVFFGGAKRLHSEFDDPAALRGSDVERLGLFRRVRDELRIYLADFAQKGLSGERPAEGGAAWVYDRLSMFVSRGVG